MEFSEIKTAALKVAALYDQLNLQNGSEPWTHREYAEGLVGDVGDLLKLIMAKSGARVIEGDLDDKIEHELVDCLWSVILIAEQLNIDLDSAAISQLDKLAKRVEQKISSTR